MVLIRSQRIAMIKPVKIILINNIYFMKERVLILVIILLFFSFLIYLFMSSRSGNNALTMEDLRNFVGTVNYQVIGDENIPEKAEELHQLAVLSGQNGLYDEAIKLLKEAHQLAPDWPYPIYDLAYTYLLKGDFENALSYYKMTDSLAPEGFFTSKTALWVLEKEESGTYPKGLYLDYLEIESISDKNKKINIARNLTEKYPDFAPAWKELAIFSDDNNEKMQFIENGLKNNPDSETKGILLINKALILNSNNRQKEAIEILNGIILDKNSTVGNKTLAQFAVDSI
jgi:tetratricopeptide (TPR) repeat protein